MSKRYWGIWTRGKLQILSRYLQAFVTTTKNKSPERVYLDLFAGQIENRDRLTQEELLGSPRIALDVADPPFTRLAFFELGKRTVALETALRARYQDRRFRVYDDANRSVQQALADLGDVAWAPTFAFVDPDGPDCHWTTLAALADHKRDRKFQGGDVDPVPCWPVRAATASEGASGRPA